MTEKRRGFRGDTEPEPIPPELLPWAEAFANAKIRSLGLPPEYGTHTPEDQRTDIVNLIYGDVQGVQGLTYGHILTLGQIIRDLLVHKA